MNKMMPPEQETFDAAELGAMMREMRENLGHDLSDVATDLRIRLVYLEAIEAGRLSDLPGSAYVSGFLRAYSDYLGLDGEEIVRRFRQAGVEISNQTRLHLPSPVEEGRLPTGPILLVAAILAAAAYGGWYYLSSQDRDPVETVAKLPPEISEMVNDGTSDTAAAPLAAAATTSGTANGAAPAAVSEPEPAASEPVVSEPAEPAAEPAEPEEAASAPAAEPAPPAETPAEPAPQTAAAPPASPEMPAEPAAEPEPAPAPEAAAESGPAESDPAESDPDETPEPDTASAAPAEAPAPPQAEAPAQPAEPQQAMTTESAPPAAPPESDAAAEPAEPPVAATPVAPVPPVIVQQSVASRPEPVPAQESDGQGFDPDARIVVRATADSYVAILAADSTPLFSQLMRPGDTYEVPSGADLTLETGNAGGLEIMIGERRAPALGPLGSVRRNIPLDAAKLMEGAQ